MNKFTRILKPGRNRKETPVEALDLERDLNRLDDVMKKLELVDEMNIGESLTQQQRDHNHDMMRSVLALIRSWQRHATRTQRRKYLMP